MGQTPRDRLTQIPLPTRSTEASAECFGRIVLTYLREDEQAEASFFMLGDLLHRGIEHVILKDADLDEMLMPWLDTEMEKLSVPGPNAIESSKRGFDTIPEDYARMMRNFFTSVHPDSEKRHPIYEDYEWPPRVEVEFQRTARSAGTKYPVWGSVDSLFIAKDGDWDAMRSETGEEFLIIDWKSGTQKQKSDFQLNFYRFGMNLPGAKAGFHHLDRVRKNSIIQPAEEYPGNDEVRKSASLTERRKDAVIKGRMPRFVPDWYCNYCPVQHLCPVDGDPRNRKRNGRKLKTLLQSVEAMETIPSQVEGGQDIGIR